MKQIIIFILIVTLVPQSCKDGKKNIKGDTTQDSLIDRYVSQRSNTFLKSNDAIRITFVPGDYNAETGQEIDQSKVWISPSVEGKFFWNSDNEIVFEPEVRFENGVSYKVSINLKSLLRIEDAEAEVINIAYQVLPLSLAHNISGLTFDQDGKSYVITGELTASDHIDINALSNIIEAKQDRNSELEISWKSLESSNFQYKIHNIKRYDNESSLNIAWDGNRIDSKFKGNQNILVPKIGDFSILKSSTAGDGNKKISIVFSDLIDQVQDLKGLIRIENYKGVLNFEIENNVINVYPKGSVSSPIKLNVDESIRNIDGKRLLGRYTKQLNFEVAKPELSSMRTGMIVPSDGKLIVPFKAKNLRFVDVEVFKLFENNVLQFLQYNNLNNNINQRVVGKVVYKQKVELSKLDMTANDTEWVKYALDLNDYVSADKGALYEVQIGFRQGYAYSDICNGETQDGIINDGTYGLDAYGNDYNRYDYSRREDPCHRSYYMSDKYISQNILSSNIGLIVKGNPTTKHWTIFTTNLRKSGPLSGATIELYDYQQQLITTSMSDGNGSAIFTPSTNPSFAIAKHSGEFGYINLQDGFNNTLSEFDVGGISKKDGMDGYIYGERGVWRPGDTIFLSFILNEPSSDTKVSHPVIFEVRDARSKTIYNDKAQKTVGNIYHTAIPTESNAPTGNWTAKVRVGNSIFTKTLKIETIKPNKLKIKYNNLAEEYDLSDRKNSLVFNARWLHGAKVDGLKAEVDVQYKEVSTIFDKYRNFVFDDPARRSDFQTQKVLNGRLDEQGDAKFSLSLDNNIRPKGKLKANIKTRVYEKSGNFSEDYVNVNVSPYSTYVGINIPKSRWGSNFIQSGEKTKVPIVIVDNKGKPIPNRKLEVGLYAAQWNWWYNRSYNNMYEYSSSNHLGAIDKAIIMTNSNGEAEWTADLDGYGNYLVRVCDTESGHCSGGLFYTSEWGMPNNDINSPKTFEFSAAKPEYNVGDQVVVKIPSNDKAKILLTIENSDGVAQSYWIDGQENQTEVKFELDKSMAPNIYVHALLIQPYNEHSNDLPLRLYGILPLSVLDASAALEPVVEMPAQLKPNSDYQVKVKEKDGRQMTYTLAVVDEGLLDLTRYKTPNAYDRFYGKQALSTKTWDIYNYVASGYDRGILNVLSIGGDGEGIASGAQKANRFKPVVSFVGPFNLDANGQGSHQLSMSNYVGSVRVMVVAANDNAYGSTEKTVPVKQALMVSTTLPRVLAPGEIVDAGVNIFAVEDNVKDVNVSLSSSGAAEGIGKMFSTLRFDNVGDQLENFVIKIPESIGKGVFDVEASSGNKIAKEQLEVQIRNPNPHEVKTIDFIIAKGESKSIDYQLHGVEGSNDVSVELYSVPPFSLGKRVQYLIRYPYGCVEQTVSSVYPQLFLNDLSDLDGNQSRSVSINIDAGIKRLHKFQQSNGGFSYWQGNSMVDDWGTSYAGDFLLEAKAKGYYVSNAIIDAWVGYQKKLAIRWEQNNTRHSDLNQAYRLYTLAKSNNAELGSMNRMRTRALKSSTAKYLLANAYILLGQKDIASDIVNNVNPDLDKYSNGHGGSYGSELRDISLMLQYYEAAGDEINAVKTLREITKRLSQNSWYSTHTTAMSLLSVGKYLSNKSSNGMKGTFKSNDGQSLTFNTQKATFTRPILTLNTVSSKQKLIVENRGEETLYGVITVSGQPSIGNETIVDAKYIDMTIKYVNAVSGQPIEIDAFQQGQNFKAVINVKHLGIRPYGFDNLALSYTLPSGWEIGNERMSGINLGEERNYNYKDVRDDKVNYFFDLSRGETKTFAIELTASYSGYFYKPMSIVHSMYDNSIYASKKGKWVNVVKED